jgi:hypothetical protein
MGVITFLKESEPDVTCNEIYLARPNEVVGPTELLSLDAAFLNGAIRLPHFF